MEQTGAKNLKKSADLSAFRFSVSKIIFFHAAVTANQFVLPRFGKKTLQALLKFLGAVSCRLDVGNANALIGIGKRLIVFPSLRILPELVHNILRKNEGRVDDR